MSVCIGSWERYYVDENLHYFYYFTKITILRILKIIITKYYLHVLHEMVSLRTYTHISFAFTINVKAKMGIRKCMAYGIPICFTHLIQAIINHNMNSDTNEWRRLLEVSTTGRSSTLATVSSISSTSEWRKYKPINLRSSKIISYRRSCLWPTGELMLPLWWAQQIELVDGGCS